MYKNIVGNVGVCIQRRGMPNRYNPITGNNISVIPYADGVHCVWVQKNKIPYNVLNHTYYKVAHKNKKSTVWRKW